MRLGDADARPQPRDRLVRDPRVVVAGEGAGTVPAAMHADDLILISVDDHICEPADMFDAHVPAKYRDRAPRVVDERERLAAVVLRRHPGSEPRL